MTGTLLKIERSLDRRVAGKLRVALSARHIFANWPSVVARIAMSNVGFGSTSDLRVSTRNGSTMRVPNTASARSPLFEVLVDDQYLLGQVAGSLGGHASVVDIGAHVGSFSIAVAEHLPEATISCYEPSPTTYRYLRANLVANGLDARVRSYRSAVGDRTGTARLLETAPVGCENTILARGSDRGDGSQVAVVSFDDVVAANGGTVDLLKVDCEGGEYDIVLGSADASWAGVWQVVCEYHPVEGHCFSEIEDKMRERGFALWHHVPSTRAGVGLAWFTRRRRPLPEDAARTDAPVRCVLAVPAFDEVVRVAECLGSVLRSPLPPGYAWDEWVLLDGGSRDGTDGAALRWHEAQAVAPAVRVMRAPKRRGKAADLTALHEELIERADPPDMVVVIDADTRVTPSSIARLVAPFGAMPALAVAWGRNEPDRDGAGFRASAFQMRAVAHLASSCGPAAIRAEGRFFAYRLEALRQFRWQPGWVTDDKQLAAWLARHEPPVWSPGEALAFATPAGTLRDFYLQTYRYFAAEPLTQGRKRGGGPRSHGAASSTRSRDPRFLALWGTARRDPGGALAYAIYRCLCVALHRFRPVAFSDLWEPSLSTKGRVSSDPERGRGVNP